MTLLRPALNYTAKDFDALRQRLFNVIPSAFPDWTDQQVADFGNILVELMAYVGDVMTFYQDNQAQESRWSTATLRRSIMSLVKLIRYVPKNASAATTQLLVQLNAVPVGSVDILAGDTFSTLDAQNPVVFQAVSDVTIEAGANPPLAYVDVENSSSAQDLYTSSRLPNQQYILNELPYVDDSLTILADDGEYLLVDDLLSSTAIDRHAVLSVDENSRAHVLFGDAVAGAIPTGAIRFNYKTGGGPDGNVSRNSINKPLKNYTDNLGNFVSLTVTNPADAGGGGAAQTVESIRERAPLTLRALTRTVCREDYEINAQRVSGVARSLMLSRDEYSAIAENQGILYVIPKGGGTATETLLSQVYEVIHARYPKTITFKLAVLTAKYLAVNIVVRIHLQRGAIGSVVAKAVRDALSTFFAIDKEDGSRNDDVDFGFYLEEALAWSDVFNVIRDTRGVRKIDDGLGNLQLNGATEDLTIPVQLFPILGTVVVVEAISGTAL